MRKFAAIILAFLLTIGLPACQSTAMQATLEEQAAKIEKLEASLAGTEQELADMEKQRDEAKEKAEALESDLEAIKVELSEKEQEIAQLTGQLEEEMRQEPYADSIMGDWKFAAMEMQGLSVDIDELTDLGMDFDFSLTVKEDGTFVMAVDMPDMNETVEGTWVARGFSYILTVDGEEQEVTLSEGGRELIMAVEDVTVTFRK